MNLNAGDVAEPHVAMNVYVPGAFAVPDLPLALKVPVPADPVVRV